MTRALGWMAVGVLTLGLAVTLHASDEDLDALKRRLELASGRGAIGRALDAISAQVKKGGGFATYGALGDWLGEVGRGRATHPLVLQRRGWAYVMAKRGPEAIPLLQTALEDEPGDIHNLAYLGEALRQDGQLREAMDHLARAWRGGNHTVQVHESAMESAVALRLGGSVADAQGLPAYAEGMRRFLQARPDAVWHATLARWLLWDLDVHDKPDTPRGRLWATVAGDHALTSIQTSAETQGGADRLAFDAAVALTAADAETGGRTPRFDLLRHACLLGEEMVQGGTHPIPQAFTLIAESAFDQERYALAARMARRRLEISFSPRAFRLMGRLPADVQE